MTKKGLDMRGLKRTGALTWSARLSIPKARWADVGRAYATASGIKQDVIRSLETRDHQEAVRRRDRALGEMRAEVDAKLVAVGLKPLHGDWAPVWACSRESLMDEAFGFRQTLADSDDYREPEYNEAGHRIAENLSHRAHGEDIVLERLKESTDRIASQIGGSAGIRAGQEAFDQAYGIAFGKATPIGQMLDRWLKDIAGTVTAELIDRHKLSFRQLGEFIAQRDGHPAPDPMAYVRALSMESINKRTAGGFREWMLQHGCASSQDNTKAVHPNTVAARISCLKSLWDWTDHMGLTEMPNPWLGATRGLKRRAEKAIKVNGEKRPFTEAELLSLLAASPRTKRNSEWGPAIYDAFRLGLLTGARQNEIASLTAGRVVQYDEQGALWGITITADVGKTKSAVRRIPLHPIARTIIERRLRALPEGSGPDALLFPECKPGGRDDKHGHYLSKRFATFRQSVVGKESPTDFHSTRRCFATFMATALAYGVTECSDLVRDHLIGHKPMALGSNTYAAKDLGWDLYSAAILGMVAKGMPESVVAAL